MCEVLKGLRAAGLAAGVGLLGSASGCALNTAVGESGDAIDQQQQAGAVESSASALIPGYVTTAKPYVVPMSVEYAIQPLLSSGDRVPRTSDPAQQYQMVGIPDGIGAYRDGAQTV